MSTQQAIWKGTVVAESDETIVVERNHYFPPDAVRRDYLQPSSAHSSCFWKGTASYYDLVVDGERNPEAAWYYPDPSAAASRIAGYVAFWHGVKVCRVRDESDRAALGSGRGWLRRRFLSRSPHQ